MGNKAKLLVRPLYAFNSNVTYVIAGGLGGVGRSITRWMAARGARHFLLLSRSGVARQSARIFVDELSRQNVQVLAPPCDICNLEKLREVLHEALQIMPPIKGCIQGAMSLRDAIFENMTWQDWAESTRPKVTGSWNLHLAMPPNLDFFVMLSSISCILGGVSQSNYAAGNAYQNALCRYRHTMGLYNTTAINLGMLIDEGIVAEDRELLASMRKMLQFMDTKGREMFALLENHLKPHVQSHVTSDKHHEYDMLEAAQPIFGIQGPAAFIAARKQLPTHLKRPMFRHFQTGNDQKGAQNTRDKGDTDFASTITGAATVEDGAAYIQRWFTAKMSTLLGIKAADLDVSRPVASYGIDSLIGMELRNWFEQQLRVKIPIFELISSSASIGSICLIAASQVFM